MKILVIRFSSIGDIVLTTPVLRCLRKQLPDAEIHFLTKQVFAPILAANPNVDKIQVLAQSWDTMLHELKEENYDLVIDLHHNIRTMRIKKALNVEAHSFPKLNFEKYVYVNLKWNILPKKHIVDRYMETVSTLGVKPDGKGLEYYIPKEEEVPLSDIPAAHHAGYYGFVIGAALGTKQYPAHHWKKLCEQLDHPIILLGGKEDQAMGEEIAAVDPVKIYNACGKFSINESADLVRRARIIVSNDTGLMHIAAAFQKQVVSLWGNTTPSFGMYPYYGDGIAERVDRPYDIVEINKLRCRPCSKIGYKKCPKGHFKCMELIAPETVADLIRKRR